MLSSHRLGKYVLLGGIAILLLTGVFALPQPAHAQGVGCQFNILMYDTLILRSNPSWASAISTTLLTGETVCLTGRTADTTWFQVTRGGLIVGWGPANAFWANIPFSLLPVVGSTTTPPPTTGQTYVVQWGDTLFSIAQRFGVNWQALASANQIYGPYYPIYAGQVLVISTATTPPPTSGYTTYTVQRGEYLVSIARKYGLTWQALATANNIGYPYTIYTGQVLIIPR
ncbi:MAG TPA: LysM peptidoglycan-binding domain-containing protein [Aggregatilineaceae bacterium]|nr:LysM peptidoglycan-binding domain-containing protein [Aggregatilineaceae bacterium]